MKCEKCGAFLDGLELNMFNWDGSDSWYNVPVEMADEDAAVVDTEQSWTGYELTEEEMLDCIRCPKCKKFPFESREIQLYNIVRLVMFRGTDSIEEQSAVEEAIVPIHCKNCQYSRPLNDKEKVVYLDECMACCNGDATIEGYNIVMPEHFCSYGKRCTQN